MGFLKNEKNFIFSILILSIIIGLIYTAIAPPRPMNYDDAVSWDAVARNLLMGKGFLEKDNTPTSIRPPLYPLFLAFIYLLFGTNLIFVKLAQVLLNAFTIFMVYLIGKEAFNSKIAKITAFILCFYPPLLVYTGIIGSETLFISLLTVVIYAIIIWFKNNNIKSAVYAGIALGIANLCRSTALLYPFFLLISLFLVFRKERLTKYIKYLIIIILFSFVIVLPWTIRNYITFEKFLLVNTSSGELFWAGTYGPWDGVCITDRDKHFFELFDNKKIKNPVELDQIMFREGIKNIKDNPGCFLKLTVKKFFRFWFQPVGQVLASGKSRFIGMLIYFVHFAWLCFAVFGFIASKDKRILYMPLTVLFVYFTIMHNLIPPIARYRLPIEPYIMIFAVYGLLNLPRKHGITENKEEIHSGNSKKGV